MKTTEQPNRLSLVTSTPTSERPTQPRRDPLNRAFYLPRLAREHYQGDAVVFWTLTLFDKATGWLTPAWGGGKSGNFAAWC